MGDHGPVVYLVDDDPGVLRAVGRVLRGAGLSTALYESPERFLAEHDPFRPGCAVLDLSMPGIDGLELQRSLEEGTRSVAPRQVLFLTGKGDVPTSVDAMRRGAVDFLVKPVDETVLVGAVRQAIDRDAVVRQRFSEFLEIKARVDTLTPREREVMALVASGKLNKQVATVLGTTEKTVKVHRARVMDKMMAGSLADLVRLADRGTNHGL